MGSLKNNHDQATRAAREWSLKYQQLNMSQGNHCRLLANAKLQRYNCLFHSSHD